MLHPMHTLSKGRGKSRVTTPVPLPLPSHTLHHYPGGFAYPWYSLVTSGVDIERLVFAERVTHWAIDGSV